jgi:hypothetical protein
VPRPSAAGQGRAVALYLAGIGFVTIATGALIAMIVFTPQQTVANHNTTAYGRGVNQHTTYSALLRSSVRMNSRVAQLARSDNVMIKRNLAAARATLTHAGGIQANLDRVRPASGTAATLNLLIAGESARIAKLNAQIRNTMRDVATTSRTILAGVRLNNVRDGIVLAAAKAIARDQAASAGLQRRILAHVSSSECSPLIRACGSPGRAPHPPRRLPNTGEQPGARAGSSHRSPSAPKSVLPTAADHSPAVPGTRPTHLLRRILHPKGTPLLPLVGAVETGVATSGVTGAVATVITICRRRRRRGP